MRSLMAATVAAVFVSSTLFANPYPDERAVPKDSVARITYPEARDVSPQEFCRDGKDVLRVEVKWVESSDSFELGEAVIERSGTPALLERAKTENAFGSYKGKLTDAGGKVFHDAIGTGQEFRHLTRAITFRFPKPEGKSEFVMRGENPRTGAMEEALRIQIDAKDLRRLECGRAVETKLLKSATQSPALVLVIYADGYLESGKSQFWKDAQKVVSALEKNKFPELDRLEFRAAFAASNTKLGKAKNLGLPIKERDSFLGLYYPYWRNFGRWYNVVYPTREGKYRAGLAQVPYDYPIVVMDNAEYWGIGNFNELTAIPSSHPSFSYLLVHEFGHFYGLNEEYEGGGRTELEFAPEIFEPWSQNITFSTDPQNIKWKDLMDASTPVPTPQSDWTGSGPYGVYPGGYADSEPLNHSHKPGYGCVMRSGRDFCPICRRAVSEKIRFDSGSGKR